MPLPQPNVRRLRTLMAGASLVTAAAGATAAPVGLQIVKDTPLQMTGVISGSLLQTNFGSPILTDVPVASGGYYNTYVYSFAEVGSNWRVDGMLTEDRYYTAGNSLRYISYSLSLDGWHNVAPHADETAPNNLSMHVFGNNLSGETEPPVNKAVSKLSDQVPHLATDHIDTMKLTFSDLNGASPGVIGNYQVAAVFTMAHPVPEPETYALMIAGLGAIGATTARRRRGIAAAAHPRS